MQPLIVADQVVQGVSDFLRAAFPSSTRGFDQLIESFLTRPDTLFHGPYLSIPLPFRPSPLVGTRVYPWLSSSFVPHAHQAKAFAQLSGEHARSVVVATGTGSGKTECFLYPILEHCRVARANGERGIKAIILYPMNALAADQASRFAKDILTHPALSNIRAGLYVGEKSDQTYKTVSDVGGQYSLISDRAALRDNPPDILLTNYKMLDFLLMRADDAGLWQHQAPDTLRYLVVDELHTFDGAQGTDLACLIRRLKGRLDTPPQHLRCVGTSATLGDDKDAIDSLTRFASDIFAETIGQDQIIREDRVSVGEYLEESVVEHTLQPQATDEAKLDPAQYKSADDYLATQYQIWFGRSVSSAQVNQQQWRCELGEALKGHFAFQNLLRDLDRLGGRSVPVQEMVKLLTRRTTKRDDARFAKLWLSSLLSLVAHARKAAHQDFFLQVKVEIWLRELRRMVAKLDPMPTLQHFDSLGSNDKDAVYLPIVYCRDCHATGWGATQTKTGGNQLVADLQTFYTAFFAEDTNTRFLFPQQDQQQNKVFTPKKICLKCAALNQTVQSACDYCGHDQLMPIEITDNLKEGTRHGATLIKSSHDCPYCQSPNSISVLGSQAASLASVMIGQIYSSRFNEDRKLIAFSDSVQDAAHRAGFFAARTWKLNLRPALAQVIAAAQDRGESLTLAALPEVFAQYWQERLGIDHYIANFLPPQFSWLRDLETLNATGHLPPDSTVPKKFNDILPWLIQSEFGQEAHIGRTLIATGTAEVIADAAKLLHASEWLQPRLAESFGFLEALSVQDCEQFLQALIGQMKRIGAWWHDGLKRYAAYGCNPHLYQRSPTEYKLLTAARSPRFLSIREFKKCVSVEKNQSQIFTKLLFDACPQLHDWALLSAVQIRSIYDWGLHALQHAGLAQCEESDPIAGKDVTEVWGLAPDAFAVQLQADHLESPYHFFRHLYLTATIQRVVAHEHTGLLPRETRERVEQSFKSNGNQAGKINLLSATPTLEMGIDIGDLSATLMCSVPPKQANYLQRAGRAGRSTGNALLATVALSRPHDLYFWEAPREMLAGSVRAPGVYLNASAVLERQLTAFTLDCWVHEHGQAASQIPKDIRSVLSAVRTSSQLKFPFPWLQYVEQNRGTLLDRFVALFLQGGESALYTTTQTWLQKFINGSSNEAGSLAWKIIDHFNGMVKDIDEFKRQREKIDRQRKKIEANAVLGDTDQKDLSDLQQEKMALSRLIASIEGKPTLQVLTDEGLLPNYAFPEQGVLLRSIILREQNTTGSQKNLEPLTFEYERPSSTAITELAPNNTFYAEGRRVEINQVDVSKVKPEPWRFCRQCSYTLPIVLGDHDESCPRCGDTFWRDSGRVRDMLKLTTVFARTVDRESRISDDSDERKRGFYLREALVDSSPDDVTEGYVVDRPEFPFGFEFLSRVSFREINFGERELHASSMVIAGKDQPRAGFAICPECGALQRKRRQEEQYRNHAPYCSMRKADSAPVQQCVFLYREFESEGLRIYLADANNDPSVLSFVAALQLGLNRHFKGAVDHLRIALDMRMSVGQEDPQCYLVIYDSVPGGTGYLKGLMRDEKPLFEVFEAGLSALNACACNQDEHKDGCYHCVFVYQNSFDRKHVSRRLAQRILTNIVAEKANLKSVAGLSAIQPSNKLFDSELEKRFVEVLRREHNGVKFDVTEVLIKGKPCYMLHAGQRRWRLEPQVYLSDSQGVTIASKPDFVFWPDDKADDLPIALFLDGWKYHQHSIADDLAKRMAIAKSGRFSVWTLTWHDIKQFNNPTQDVEPSIWSSLILSDAVQTNVVAKMAGALDVAALGSWYERPSFLQLHSRLAQATHKQLQRLASALAVGLSKPKVPNHPVTLSDDINQHAFWQQLQHSDLLPSGVTQIQSDRISSALLWWRMQTNNDQLRELMRGAWTASNAPQFIGLWNDLANIPEQERQSSWQALWQIMNMMLPLPHCWAGTAEMPALDGLKNAGVFHAASGMHPEWLGVFDVAASEVQDLLMELATAGAPVPLVGFELLDSNQLVVAESELAWPDQHVVLLLDSSPEIEALWTQHGWSCLVVTPLLSVEQIMSTINAGNS